MDQEKAREVLFEVRAVLERCGGRVVRIPRSALGSTTDIVRRVFEVLG